MYHTSPIDVSERKARKRFGLSRVDVASPPHPTPLSLINKHFCVPARDIPENLGTYFKLGSRASPDFLE